MYTYIHLYTVCTPADLLSSSGVNISDVSDITLTSNGDGFISFPGGNVTFNGVSLESTAIYRTTIDYCVNNATMFESICLNNMWTPSVIIISAGIYCMYIQCLFIVTSMHDATVHGSLINVFFHLECDADDLCNNIIESSPNILQCEDNSISVEYDGISISSRAIYTTSNDYCITTEEIRTCTSEIRTCTSNMIWDGQTPNIDEGTLNKGIDYYCELMIYIMISCLFSI